MNLSTYKTTLEAIVFAQTGYTAQWRDAAGGWQGKPWVRLHLHNSRAVGVDHLRWTQDTDLPPGADFVPTVCGNREITLSVLARSRDQNAPALGILEKLRTAFAKPSVQKALRDAGLAFARAEDVIDLTEWVDDRTESSASLDVHLNAVVNEKDTAEADSYAETAQITPTWSGTE